MSKSLSRVDQEQKILDLLHEDSYSITRISEITGYNYYTVRNIISDMFVAGNVKLVGTKDKHKLYTYNVDSKSYEDRIPRFTDILTKQSSKVIFILSAVGHEQELKSTQAAMNLPKFVVKLMIAANVASHGMNINTRLETIREDMQQSYLYLKNMCHLYEQILQEPRFWEPRYLKTMADDPDFIYPDIQKASDYYEKLDKESRENS